ncbi:helix-turn-helix domain-containing protein [Streptomyces bambusae]|uniref:Helix-turn-helix domain-containing protein n=1 Tax=Streptomyces bambusae TaxID=1550616 RepID=A0ABS6ZG79_9ACTN|nr:helix-turn-helix transcriptional regulator [Streptomyces bambusae]MBW5486758.1 helix-turn-helix domain-containing protein [Streptomyces bambusae]
MAEDKLPKNLNPTQNYALDVRQMRETKKMTLKGLGRATGYTESYVSKVENGRITPSEKFARGCDHAFGTGTLFLRKWLQNKETGHPSWFAPYVELEKKAAEIWDYSTMFLMGLLQTDEYARATLLGDAPRVGREVIEERVQTRIRRQEVMRGSDPPALWVVIHEGCLRTIVGGPDVMRRQLEHLVTLSESPDITLQLLPFSKGAPAIGTPFTVLMFDDGPPVMHSEGPQGGRPYDDPRTTANATRIYHRLRMLALAHDETVAFMKAMHEEFPP